MKSVLNIVLVSVICFVSSVRAQNLTPSEAAFIHRCDSLMVAHFRSIDSFTWDTTELNVYNYSADSVPEVDEETFKKRIALMDEKSPFDFIANDVSLAMVKQYVNRRYRLTSRMLGLGELYFPLFEQKLTAYHIPFELKYLPIVESALKPQAISGSGAGGLWQFMPATGKGYGLEVTSLIDERFDPYLATEAACQYLSKLYAIYGDWSMSLAAYNAGQGTVNKAIRRSGGKTDYWSIRSFLPKETQNYVPAFIAVNYVMTYASEHNIYPQPPTFFAYEMDTIHVRNRVDFGVVDHWIGYNRGKLDYLNPSYLTGIIPANINGKLPIKLPSSLVGKFLEVEDSIYKYSSLDYKYWVAVNQPAREEKTHVIKSGESLASIAKKYHCSEQDIKAWNTMTRIRIKSGRKIRVFELLDTPDNYTPSPYVSKTEVDTEQDSKEVHVAKGKDMYHVVQKGDTLWGIAKKYNSSIEELKELNSHLDISTLHAGTKLKVSSK